MKRRNGLTIAAVLLLLSAAASASSIADPGGIIRSGDGYENFAIIHPDFSITFGTILLNNGFNPFDFTESFCPIDEGTFQGATVSGPDCQFLNDSGQTINTVSEFFAASGEALSPFFCDNQITGQSCSTGPNGNALLFTGLGISPLEEYASILGDSTLNTDPAFNILIFGLTRDLAQIDSLSASVPEPASLGLMVSGLFGLGLAWKRRARKSR
jgi:PEP-CTERM motif